MEDAALQKAKAEAGATTSAVKNVEQQGYARKMDASGLGMGVVSNQATQQNIATNTGNSAVGASGAALGANQSGTQIMGQGFGTALQGMGQSGQLYGQAAGIKNQANQNALLGSLGQAAGAAAMFFSDEDMKKNTDKPVDTKKALEEVNATPVKDGWSYDPKKGGPADGGRKRTGPMAQRVRATMGETVAPGGKVIDMISMNGKLMAGMQELTKRVKNLEASK
jgi:hypothetical protein